MTLRIFNHITEMNYHSQIVELEIGMEEIQPWSYDIVKKISDNQFFSAHTEFQICIGNQNFHEIRT